LKAGSESGAARNAVANQATSNMQPNGQEVARIRLKISAKATYSK
jgi:hypothetical protein